MRSVEGASHLYNSHLLDVDEPLLVFSGLKMRCGEVLHSAEMVYARAVNETLSPVDYRVDMCQKCQASPAVSEAKRTYEYGLREKVRREKAENEEWEAVS